MFQYLYCFRPSNSSQPIWSVKMLSASFDKCFGNRNFCPVTSVTSCSHSNDVTVTCSK